MKIKEVAIGFNKSANNVQLVQGGYVLGSNEQCKVRVEFFNNTDLLHTENVVIPKEIVSEWSEDDTPLIDYVINKLNLEVIPNELL